MNVGADAIEILCAVVAVFADEFVRLHLVALWLPWRAALALAGWAGLW